MYFICYQPFDHSYTKFVHMCSDKLTDDFDMAYHSLDIQNLKELLKEPQLINRKGNYFIFKFIEFNSIEGK